MSEDEPVCILRYEIKCVSSLLNHVWAAITLPNNYRLRVTLILADSKPTVFILGPYYRLN
jgi:hypothetical protein